MTLTIQVVPIDGAHGVYVHVVASGATEATPDTLNAWLGEIEAELQTIPDLGAHLVSLEGPYVPPTDATAAWAAVPIPRAALTDNPFIRDAVVKMVVGQFRRLVEDRLQVRRIEHAPA